MFRKWVNQLRHKEMLWKPKWKTQQKCDKVLGKKKKKGPCFLFYWHIWKIVSNYYEVKIKLKISVKGVIKSTNSIVLCYIAQLIKLLHRNPMCCQPVSCKLPCYKANKPLCSEIFTLLTQTWYVVYVLFNLEIQLAYLMLLNKNKEGTRSWRDTSAFPCSFFEKFKTMII